MDIAQAVRSNRADCGIAPRSVALAAGLNFLPITWEHSDLVLRQRDYFLPGPQALFGFMRTAALREHAMELGGYDVDAIARSVWSTDAKIADAAVQLSAESGCPGRDRQVLGTGLNCSEPAGCALAAGGQMARARWKAGLERLGSRQGDRLTLLLADKNSLPIPRTHRMRRGCGTRAHRQHHVTEQGLIAKH